jgi:hypothetical protein
VRRRAHRLVGVERVREGDLSDRDAGLLIFLDGRERPDYVPWGESQQLAFDRTRWRAIARHSTSRNPTTTIPVADDG